MMKKNFVAGGLILLCSVILFAQAPQAPLMKNGDFSQVVGGNPADWQCVYPKGAFTVTGEGAERFITLNKSDAKSPCMLVHRKLSIASDKKYVVSCEVRSANEGDVLVYVEWRTPVAGGKFKHNSVNAVKIAATETWKEIAFVIPPRAKECETPYLVINVAAGKVDIRKLVIEEQK